MAIMNLEKSVYQNWQKKLETNKLFRYWWQFWSNYSFVFYIVAGFILLFEHHLVAIIILGIASFVVARVIITAAINAIYKKQRPYQKFNLNVITSRFFSMRDAAFNSFPSRHTIAYASVAGSILVFNSTIGIALLLVAILTGIARVVLGYHWPSDILAGFILGTIIGYLLTIYGLIVFFT
jgi:membrane-associated phospholipid phosphatase